MFKNLKAQGLSVSEISRLQHCDRKTVRKYLNADCDDLQAIRRKARIIYSMLTNGTEYSEA